WNIANALRGNMGGADEFRDYILGFIFYKYLSEKMHLYADELLQEDGIKYESLDVNTDEGQQYLEAVKKESINQLGYFLLPDELFHTVSERGVQGEFVIESLTNVL
ncbi:MAG: type I restriction-modification system subunit M N-terminal domain-containing protein, partial [Methylococcales bacterium]